MSLMDWIDEDVIFNPMYWFLTGAVEIALLIGFKLQSAWTADVSMPLYSKIGTLLLIPVASYFIVKKVAG